MRHSGLGAACGKPLRKENPVLLASDHRNQIRFGIWRHLGPPFGLVNVFSLRLAWLLVGTMPEDAILPAPGANPGLPSVSGVETLGTAPLVLPRA